MIGTMKQPLPVHPEELRLEHMPEVGISMIPLTMSRNILRPDTSAVSCEQSYALEILLHGQVTWLAMACMWPARLRLISWRYRRNWRWMDPGRVLAGAQLIIKDGIS
jgi:hypothetical protein